MRFGRSPSRPGLAGSSSAGSAASRTDPGPRRSAAHRLPDLPGQAPRRWTGRLHPPPDQGAGRPRPPRRGAVGPAVPDRRRAGPAGRAPSLDIYNDHFPMRMPGLWELKTLDGTSPRSPPSRSARSPSRSRSRCGPGTTSAGGSASSTSSRTTSAWATACSRSSAAACRCSARSTTRSPSTAASRWSTPRRRGSAGRRPAGTPSPRCRRRVAQRLERVITVSQLVLRRHLPRPTACRPRSCSSCRSASTPTCSGRSRASSAGAHQIISTASADVAMKGQRYLLEALAKLRTEYPDLTLVMVGRLKEGSVAQRTIRAARPARTRWSSSRA